MHSVNPGGEELPGAHSKAEIFDIYYIYIFMIEICDDDYVLYIIIVYYHLLLLLLCYIMLV